MRDRLVAAVLRGEKVATSSLLADREADGEQLAEPGDRLNVVDSAGRPVAVIELTAVEVIRLGHVDLELARDEGEGFQSVEEWREAHERVWADAVLTGETKIVVERFRLASRR